MSNRHRAGMASDIRDALAERAPARPWRAERRYDFATESSFLRIMADDEVNVPRMLLVVNRFERTAEDVAKFTTMAVNAFDSLVAALERIGAGGCVFDFSADDGPRFPEKCAARGKPCAACEANAALAVIRVTP